MRTKHREINCKVTPKPDECMIASNPDSLILEAKKVYIPDSGKTCAWELGEIMGERSASGVIYNTKCGSDAKYIYKQVSYIRPVEQLRIGYINTTDEEFIRECDIQMDMASHGLSPKIHQIFTGENWGGIIMDMIRGVTVKRWILDQLVNHPDTADKNVYDMLTQVIKMIEIIHSYGITHGDTHLNNFMISGDKLLVIDFGLSKYINELNVAEQNDSKRNDFEMLIRDFNHIPEEKELQEVIEKVSGKIRNKITDIWSSIEHLIQMPEKIRPPLKHDQDALDLLETELFKTGAYKGIKNTIFVLDGGDVADFEPWSEDKIEKAIQFLEKRVTRITEDEDIPDDTDAYLRLEEFNTELNLIRKRFGLD